MTGQMEDLDLGFDLTSDPIFPTGYVDTTPATQTREHRGFPWHSLMWSRGGHWHPVTDRDVMRILLAGTRNGDILFVTRQPGGHGEPVVQVAGYTDHDARAVEVVTADDATYQVARIPAPVHLAEVDTVPVGAQRKGERVGAVVYAHPAFMMDPDAETMAIISAWIGCQQPPDGYELVPWAQNDTAPFDDERWWV